MTTGRLVHRRLRTLLGGLAAICVLAATTSTVLLGAPTAATASPALPCTYSEVIDENGDYAGAVPNRDEADTAMTLHTHQASDQTPAGKIAVINAISGFGHFVITSITATDSDGTFTVTGPAASLNFDATTHSTTLSNYPADTLAGCYTDVAAATPTSTPAPTTTPSLTLPSATSSTTTATTTASATAADPTTTPGGTETISAGGFEAGEAVSAVLHSTSVQLGNFTANAAGVVTAAFTVPTTLETGAHTVVLTGLTSGHVATAHFTVDPATTDLASTGVMHAEELLASGVGAVGLGAGLLALTMRRRRTAPRH